MGDEKLFSVKFVKIIEDELTACIQHNQKLKAQLALAKEALEHYANHADIAVPGPIKVIHRGSVSTVESNGEATINSICGVAREALAKLNQSTQQGVGE